MYVASHTHAPGCCGAYSLRLTTSSSCCVTAASSAATATCSDGILNGDESDTDCGHSDDGCSLCSSGRVCASTSNCDLDTVCATNSGSNLCTEIGITEAGEYVLFEAVLHGSLSAEDFVGDLRQGYLEAVAAELGVAVRYDTPPVPFRHTVPPPPARATMAHGTVAMVGDGTDYA